jgi:hypothetical protein
MDANLLALLEILKNVPGAKEAIGFLVTGVTGEATGAFVDAIKFGRVHLQRLPQATKDQMEADSEISKELTKAKKKAIRTNAKISERRALFYENDQLRKQSSREAIGLETLEDLRLDPPTFGTTGAPSEDWMNVFVSYAERASSNNLRKIWARVLSGEIRKPGSFSFRTVQFMSVLDPELAKSVEFALSCTIGSKYIPMNGPLSRNPHYDELLTLSGVGFLTLASEGVFENLASPEGTELAVGKSHRLIVITNAAVKSLPRPALPRCAVLTPLGIEVARVVAVEPNLDLLEAEIEAIKHSRGFDLTLR